MTNNPSAEKGPQLPVHNASYADIREFRAILSERNVRTVRLPTAGEWEYAARVGTSNPAFLSKYTEADEESGKRFTLWGKGNIAGGGWTVGNHEGFGSTWGGDRYGSAKFRLVVETTPEEAAGLTRAAPSAKVAAD